ncbi:hypothetical protein KJW28_24900 [Pseudomonas syringae pv. aptata]|nr:hypothetical protein [Pseudomonas syringae]MCK0550808.1 hypothetical protein [Pseudomonas syringae pv. aptata]
MIGKCEFAKLGKGVRHRYALVEQLFLIFHAQIPFHKIIIKSDDIKALEKEYENVSGLIILKEKALANNFSILEKSSESAQKYIMSRIDEVSLELDKLKLDEHRLKVQINSLHIASKSELKVIEIYRLLVTEKGRVRINNFLHSQKVKLIITPIMKKYFSIEIVHDENHIDTIDVTPTGYTARINAHLK